MTNIGRQPKLGDDQRADDRGGGKARDDDEGHESHPAAARGRRHEFGHGRIADHDLGAEAQAHHEPRGDQPIHAGRRGGGEGREAEDDQVELVGEAPAEPVAEEAGDHRADGHADEGPGDELRDLGEHGELRSAPRRPAPKRRHRDRSRRRTCRRRSARRCGSGTTRSAAGRAARRYSPLTPLDVSPGSFFLALLGPLSAGRCARRCAHSNNVTGRRPWPISILLMSPHA